MISFDGENWQQLGTNPSKGCYSEFTIDVESGNIKSGVQNVPLPSARTGDFNENNSNNTPDEKEEIITDKFHSYFTMVSINAMCGDFKNGARIALEVRFICQYI